IVEEIVRELHTGRDASPAPQLDSSLDSELALDSLSRVELGARLERAFDVTLAESAVFDAGTPRDLLRIVLKSRKGAPVMLRELVDQIPQTDAVQAPIAAQTLGELLAWHVARHGDRAHIQIYDDYTDGEVLTYRDLHAGAARVAGALQAQGLMPGERVALMLPTSREYFFVFYGVVLAGGVPVPIYPPVRRQQLEDHLSRQSRILSNCGAVMLVTTDDALTVAHLLTASVESLRRVLGAGALVASSDELERVVRRAEDTAFLQYTSGSTGDPKGVILTHANLMANMRADGQGMAATPNDVFVSWLPLYHDMGLIGAWLGSLYHAVRLVVMPPMTFLARPERWLWAIHRYRGSMSAAPNFAYELCLKRIGDDALAGLDLSSWRIAANGAEAISARTMEAFCERFEPYGFKRESMFPVYGLAECSVGLAFSPLGRGALTDTISRDALSRKGVAIPVNSAVSEHETLSVVACGQPLPLHEIRIVDEAGRELPERQVGQLEFRGPSATAGYFDRPDETAKLIHDGWLRSGDRAYVAGGELYVTGRIKDLIIRAGRNIYPAELEDAIGDLDGIRKGHVAIFGTPDAASGTERLVVMAETRKRADESREALRVAINELATDLVAAPPDQVELVSPNTVLRTSSGKIRRGACRALYEEGRIGQHEHALWRQVAHLAIAGVMPQARRALKSARTWLYASWAWAVFVSLAMVAWLVTWLPVPDRVTLSGVRAIARGACALVGVRVSLNGAEHLPPAGEACVLVANHQSYLDGMVLLGLLPRTPRFLVKGDLQGSTALSRPLRRIGTLFVERFDAQASIVAMKQAADALGDGGALMIFPEGTFKRMPGVLPFRMGAFTTAAQ
ncbi:MAG: AMP-binding protein, partial [Chromatiales bacterium]|nr:AMP-binding protein [Chromatiales bacterium]